MTSTNSHVRRHSRRDLLLGNSVKNVQIASVLVQARPEQAEEIARAIDSLSDAESYRTEAPSRLIVAIEAASDADLMEAMSDIADMDGVISTSLVYHQIERSDDV